MGWENAAKPICHDRALIVISNSNGSWDAAKDDQHLEAHVPRRIDAIRVDGVVCFVVFFRTDATRRIGAESLFAAADWPTRETESAPGMQMMPGSAVSPAGRAGRCAIGRRRWPGVGSFLEPAVRGARGGEPKWRRRWGRSGRTGVGPARGVGRRDGGANASAVAFW